MSLLDICDSAEPKHLWTCKRCQKAVTSLEEGCPKCGESDRCRITNGKVEYQISKSVTIGVRLSRTEHWSRLAHDIYAEKFEEVYDRDWEIIEDEEYATRKALNKLRAEDAFFVNEFIPHHIAERALTEFCQRKLREVTDIEDFFS